MINIIFELVATTSYTTNQDKLIIKLQKLWTDTLVSIL